MTITTICRSGVRFWAVGAFSLLVNVPSSFSADLSVDVFDMLAATDTFKPKVGLSEGYFETLKRIRGEAGAITYDTVSSHRIVATVTANTAGLDLTAATAETSVGVAIGSYVHSAPLGDDPKWAPEKKRAVFPILVQDEATGEERKAGSVTYFWDAKTLNVIVSTTEESIAVLGDFIGLGDADGRPVGFADVSEVSVKFGTDGGSRGLYFKGLTRTVQRAVGRGAAAEKFTLNSASAGATVDLKGPSIRCAVPATTELDGIDLSGTLSDLPGAQPTITAILVNGVDGATSGVLQEAPDERGFLYWTAAGVPLAPGLNTITITAQDFDGNVTTITRKITSTAPAPEVF